jgi:hypothetical protein
MSYPPAPWIAFGHAQYTVRLVDIECVRALVPAPFKIIPFLPGKTFASVYFADYQPANKPGRGKSLHPHRNLQGFNRFSRLGILAVPTIYPGESTGFRDFGG